MQDIHLEHVHYPIRKIHIWIEQNEDNGKYYLRMTRGGHEDLDCVGLIYYVSPNFQHVLKHLTDLVMFYHDISYEVYKP